MNAMRVPLTVALFVVVVGLVAACASGLASTTRANLEDSARTSAAAYRYQDADTPAAALILTTHCNIQAAIRDEKLPAFDSGLPCP